MEAEEINERIRQGASLAEVASPAAPVTAGATLRERWRRTMFFQSVDRIPNWEFGYWAETLNDWHAQGLPAEVTDEASAYRYFGIENWKSVWCNADGLSPAFPEEVLADDGELVTYRDASSGCIAQINKRGHKSIPHYLDFALKGRKEWEELFKPRLQPSAARAPKNWAELVPAYNRRDYPLAINIGSLIGRPRNYMGFETIAMMVYDDPGLLEEIVEHLCQLICATLAPLLREVEFDFGTGWEDICFNSGPIVGVPFFREILAPRYKRITDLLHRHGCQVAWTDCDGNITTVVDAFLAGGINCMFPVEVHGGSDPVALRQRWPDLRLQGGFCKMRLSQGREAVRREVERLKPLVRAGGFIPGIDHRVQADASLDTYKYYLKLKRAELGVGGTPQYDESKV